MNRLVVIGWLGIKRAYLNINREEAIERYIKEENYGRPLPKEHKLVEEFEFTDSFGCYDAWSLLLEEKK